MGRQIISRVSLCSAEGIHYQAAERSADTGNHCVRRITGILWAAVFAIFLFASDEALAYEQFRVGEGSWEKMTVNLPSYPHEARRFQNAGYDGVRYKFCLSDGTAKGVDWSVIAANFFSKKNVTKGKDYIRICDLVATAKSGGRFSKWFEFTATSFEDKEKESDEYYWIYLSSPEVKRPGSSTWESHSGSHHVPSTIRIQVIIEANND